MLREWLTIIIIHHLISITMISSDANLTTDFADSINKTTNTGINRFYGFYNCGEYSRMTNYITVSVVEDDKIILT